MPKPLISVLMPVHALTPFTKAAVNSILTQSHARLELLIVGHDDVHDLVARLPADKRIHPVQRHSPGIVGALNTGLKHCQGEYIARMDSDDVSQPTRLQTQLDYAQANPGIKLLGACVDIFSDGGPIGEGNQRYQAWLNSLQTSDAIQSACMIESPLPHPSLFAHKDYWQSIGGYRDMAWPEDYDLILRTWLANLPMAKPPEILLHWREHPQRLTRTDSRYSRESFIRAKAWALTQPEAGLGLTGNRKVWICGTGRNARYWHDALTAQHVVVAGFVELDSAKTKTQKRHLPVVTYSELLPQLGDALLVSAISNPTARTTLVQWLLERGLRAGKDFIVGG